VKYVRYHADGYATDTRKARHRSTSSSESTR